VSRSTDAGAESCGDFFRIWGAFGEEVVGGAINRGHYVPEEAPKEAYTWFMRLFANGPA